MGQERTKIPTVSAPASRSYAVDDRELDDSFSAWDDDDAGAHRPVHPAPAQLASSSSTSLAQTRIERKPLAVGTGPSRRMADALVDPVAMRDIVISRARTLDDPLTTRVLAEIARGEESEREGESEPMPAPQRTRTVKLGPSRTANAISHASTIAIAAAHATTAVMALPDASLPPDTEEADPEPRRRNTRRGIPREEPARKK